MVEIDPSVKIASIASGSNGNCYYVGTQSEAILIDSGISCREIEKRMLRAGLNIQLVKAIFISHEHSDHIRGVEKFAKKYGVKVYLNAGTSKNCRFRLDNTHLCHFETGDTIEIGKLLIHSFSKSHDAADPVSFTVESNGIRIAVITDAGYSCENIQQHLKLADAAFLESNYDEKMLLEGRYPQHLKTRILSNEGHLSNQQALETFINFRSERLKILILSHLSGENNTPDIVQQLFSKNANGSHIIVASRQKETEVFSLDKKEDSLSLYSVADLKLKADQLSLSF